jgi:hypothetical protein
MKRKPKFSITLKDFKALQKSAKLKGIKIRKPSNQEEYLNQCAVIEWAKLNICIYPELEFLAASLNGVRCGIKQARKAIKSGLNSGFPDLQLSCASDFFYGLYIEMKAKGGKQSKEQKKWESFLTKEGYKYVLCYNAKEAIDVLKKYLTVSAYYGKNKP